MLPIVVSAIGTAITSEEITAANRVVSTRESQAVGVYRVLDALTGVLVEFHAYKNTAYVTPAGNIAAGWADGDAEYTAITIPPIRAIAPSESRWSFAFGASERGATVVGGIKRDYSPPSGYFDRHAFAWTSAEGVIDLGVFSDGTSGTFGSCAAAVSRDGLVVVGTHAGASGYPTPEGLSAFRCVREEALGGGLPMTNTVTYLPNAVASIGSMANAVSGDGRTIVGTSLFTGGELRAFRWTLDGGMETLELPPGATFAEATGVSDDGTVVVGHYQTGAFPINPSLPVLHNIDYSGPTPFRAFLWRLTEFGSEVFDIADGARAYATGVSGDGRTVVGFYGTPAHAFRWTEATGLVALGAPVGKTQSVAVAVSRDGMTIAGIDFIWRNGVFVFPTPIADPVEKYLPGGVYYTISCLSR